MRIERLDLVRYGAFADRTLEFARPRPGAPDLHVVFGPNEAGKSTLFAAWLDLLFGTKERRYDFQHRDGLEIGARVDVDGSAHEWRRTGTAKGGTLHALDAGLLKGRGAVDPTELATALGGLSREDYATMFSLDAGELEEGGRAILSSEGRLGELLFSAGSGLSGLSEVLLKAQEDASALFRSGGSKHELAQLKKSLAEIDAHIKDTDTRADEHERMIAARDEALRLYEVAKSEQDGVSQRLRTVERTLDALVSDDRRREADRRIGELGPLPDAPSEWIERADALSEAQTRLAERERYLSDGRARLARERDGLVPDSDAMAVAGRLDALSRGDGEDGVDPETRIRAAVADLPRREAELAALNETLRNKASVLGCPIPEGIPANDPANDDGAGNRALADWIAARVPSSVALRNWRSLLAQRAEDAATLRSAQQEARTARSALTELEDEYATASNEDEPSEEAVDGLERMVRRLRRESAGALLADLDKRLKRAAADLERLLEAKGLASVNDLYGLPPPPNDQLERWRSDLDKLNARDERLKERSGEAALRIEGLNAERSTFVVPSDEDAQAARRDRDKAWEAHKAQGGKTTATAFENALRRDDEVTRARLEGAAELAGQRQTDRELLRLRAEVRSVAEQRAAIETERAALTVTIESVAAPLVANGVVSEEPNLHALARYAEAHGVLSKHSDAIKDMETDRSEVAGQVEKAIDELHQALADMGENGSSLPHGDLEALLDRAEGAVASWRRRKDDRTRLTVRLDRARAELHGRNDAAEREERRHEVWSERWRDATAGTFMAEHPLASTEGTSFDGETASALLDEATELLNVLPAIRQLEHRVTRMQTDRDEFLQALAPIGEALGLEPPTRLAWSHVLEAARARVTAARATAAALERLKGDAKELEEEEAALERERDRHGRSQAEMATVLGTRDPNTMRSTLRLVAERDRLRGERDEAASTAARALNTAPNEVAARLESADRDALGAEGDRLRSEGERLAAAVDNTHAELVLARNALERIGGDGAAARLLSERQALVTRMEETARAALRLEFGIEAARRALHRYRETHRSAMMARASDAFAAISCGAFEGLTTRPDGEDDQLFAVRGSGEQVSVGSSTRSNRGKRGTGGEGGLSKGTRHQLYLALRIAGYHEFARRQTPPPFLCDDVMETFDDERAEATLQLLGDMAGRGQVIVLTHHRHLADIARSVVPGVQVHDLPGMTLPAAVSEAAE